MRLLVRLSKSGACAAEMVVRGSQQAITPSHTTLRSHVSRHSALRTQSAARGFSRTAFATAKKGPKSGKDDETDLSFLNELSSLDSDELNDLLSEEPKDSMPQHANEPNPFAQSSPFASSRRPDREPRSSAGGSASRAESFFFGDSGTSGYPSMADEDDDDIVDGPLNFLRPARGNIHGVPEHRNMFETRRRSPLDRDIPGGGKQLPSRRPLRTGSEGEDNDDPDADSDLYAYLNRKSGMSPEGEFGKNEDARLGIDDDQLFLAEQYRQIHNLPGGRRHVEDKAGDKRMMSVEDMEQEDAYEVHNEDEADEEEEEEEEGLEGAKKQLKQMFKGTNVEIEDDDDEDREELFKHLAGPGARILQDKLRKDERLNRLREEKRRAQEVAFELGKVPSEPDEKDRRRNTVRHKRIATAIEKALREVFFIQQLEPRVLDHEFDIIQVVVGSKFRSAKVYWRSIDNGPVDKELSSIFSRSRGKIRYAVQNRLNLKYAPELRFICSRYLEKEAELDALFEQIKQQDAKVRLDDSL